MTVTAQYDGRMFVPDGPVELPIGARVRVVVDPPAPPLAGLLDALRQQPENPDWPADGATNLDHYLYARQAWVS